MAEFVPRDAKDGTKREFQCPVCDCWTLESRGEYRICPVCFWEDDDFEDLICVGVVPASERDVDPLDRYSGPNHGETLRTARANFAAFGACSEFCKKFVRAATQAERNG